MNRPNLKDAKYLDKACVRLEAFDHMPYCPPEEHWNKEKWKEWCLKDER